MRFNNNSDWFDPFDPLGKFSTNQQWPSERCYPSEKSFNCRHFQDFINFPFISKAKYIMNNLYIFEYIVKVPKKFIKIMLIDKNKNLLRKIKTQSD